MKQRNKMNKMIALLLAMTMCCAVFTGCGSEEEKSQETISKATGSEATSSEQVSSEVAEKPLKNVDIYPLQSDKTFTVISGVNIFGDKGETAITEKMEKATGVSIDWKYMTPEQLQMTLSGKDLPDAIFLHGGGLNKATTYEYGQAGYFVNFMDYLDIMPNFAAVIEAHPEYLEAVQNEDGSVYCLPQITGGNTAQGNLVYYRTDMMKEIGWENPPATTDEFIKYVKELQAHFGKDDPEYIAYNAYLKSYISPISGTSGRYFYASFGELLEEGITLNSNDEVVFGATTDQFKHYLEFMNELWNSGAFNTNIYTQESAASTALNAGGHVGITGHHSGTTVDLFESGTLEMDIMPPLTSEYWDTPHWLKLAACQWGQFSVITTQCKDIETMVKWFDAWYSTVDNPLNEEGSIFGITPWLGEVGVDVILDDTTMTYAEAAHEGYDAGTFAAQNGFGNNLYTGFADGMFPYSMDPNTGIGVKGRGTVNNLWPYAETVFNLKTLVLTQEEQDIYNDAWADIEAYLKEMTAKFITGEVSIEAEWSNYVATMDKMGLQDVIKVYSDAYARVK